jgi:quinol monooxygenase YgiN
MSEIVVVVSLQAAEGKGDEVVKAFGEAIPPTHAEEGCVKYALHRDNNDPDHFVHIEKWRSQEDLDAHMQTPHLGAVFAALGQPGIMAGGPKMWMLSNVPRGDPEKGAV